MPEPGEAVADAVAGQTSDVEVDHLVRAGLVDLSGYVLRGHRLGAELRM